MVSQAELIAEGYHTLVPGLNLFMSSMGPFQISQNRHAILAVVKKSMSKQCGEPHVFGVMKTALKAIINLY